MKQKIKVSKKSIIIYLLIIAVICVIQAFGVARELEDRTEDGLYQKGEGIDPMVYVIGIDEETLSKYGPFAQWSREGVAELINVLNADPEYKPAVIAVDIGYFGYKDPVYDEMLAEAVRDAGNVVLTDTATFGNVPGEGTVVMVYEEPFDELKEAAAGHGHANVQLDTDGVVRHAPGTIVYDGRTISSFDTEVYRVWLEHNGLEMSEEERKRYDGSDFYIAYSGGPRSYYGAVGAGTSFCKVLEGEYPARAFADAIVYIGAFASGMQDDYYSSIDKDTRMFGVEIHANIFSQMKSGTYKHETGTAARVLITAAVGLISAAVLLMLDMKLAIPAEILIAGLYVLLTGVCYNKFNVLLPVIWPAAAAVMITVIHVAVNYFTVRMEKKKIIADYGKYLSPEVAAAIADVGESALKLGGTKKDIAVLFVDIRSFTTLSESLPPERVVEMLNSYLAITTKAIFDNKGTVDKFIGDATMGVFNAPLDLDDYTYRAVCAGLEMAELSKGLDNDLPEDLKGRVGFGVGINCGDAVVGNIGTSFRMEYTAIGDTVNTASRLEGQAKAGEVILSEAVYERVKDRIRCESIGTVMLKGKTNGVNIYKALEIVAADR